MKQSSEHLVMPRFYWTLALLLALGLGVDGVDARIADPDTQVTPHERVSRTTEHVVDDLPSDALREERGQLQNVDELMIRQTIAALDLLTQLERAQLLPWLFNAVAQQTDARLHGELARILDEKMAQSALHTDRAIAGGVDEELHPEDIPGAAQEQASFEALLQREQGLLPPEEEIRKQIDALVLNPEKPEITLTQAMEIAGVIERIEDESVRLSLRRMLEDRVTAFQAGW